MVGEAALDNLRAFTWSLATRSVESASCRHRRRWRSRRCNRPHCSSCCWLSQTVEALNARDLGSLAGLWPRPNSPRRPRPRVAEPGSWAEQATRDLWVRAGATARTRLGAGLARRGKDLMESL
ncbi:hypothetical protein ACPA9J_31935 [Pseudomonas aeruginosa]